MKVLINVIGKPVHEVDLPVVHFSYTSRIKRSTQVFLIFFLSGILSILIPVLHFVLVPGLILTAFVMAYLKFKEVAVIDLSGGLMCPECQSNIDEKKISFKKEEVRARLHCFGCGQGLEVLLEQSPS
ncbi:hypothetical protein [Pseudobdellovibrio exovorus]|uniref:Uncharacterized protein n=1 Tax=Pseudobdellovibrio exovorus JSS TaxID=1184267 RepID=M4V726_9BACT|nr:hypothetical protein [Pseudobdellovibrio exovorus]AGH94983.1 hypothetical protein A11Q_765 [Pseudobdellovibrio exovorus JSS]